MQSDTEKPLIRQSNALPVQQAKLRLIPALPSGNPRYLKTVQRNKSARDKVKTIPASFRPERLTGGNPPVPHGWAEYIHPEGDTYYYHEKERIATPINPGFPLNNELINAALKTLYSTWRPDENLFDYDVVFYTLSTDKATRDIHYCLIDHATRTPFWARDVQMSELGLDDSYETAGYLKSLLTSEYWVYVEYFPAHQDLPHGAYKELTAVLRTGCIDNMTSPGSTCPYGTEECMQYLEILKGFAYPPTEEENPYQTLCVARLWGMIARVRHINSYGLNNARLDRLQGLAEYMQTQNKFSLKLMIGEAFVLWMSRATFYRLTALWNGRVVYQRHWHSLFEEMQRDWNRMALLSIVLLIADVILFSFGSVTPLTMASASLALASIVQSLLLLQKHTKERLGTAPDISNYVMRVEDYYHGLRPVSITFTIPTALTMYSAMLFFIALLYRGIESQSSLRNMFLIVAGWSLPCTLTLLGFTLYGSSRM